MPVFEKVNCTIMPVFEKDIVWCTRCCLSSYETINKEMIGMKQEQGQKRRLFIVLVDSGLATDTNGDDKK